MLDLGKPKNDTKRAIPLALLKSADDEAIHGITRFQKLVFLLQEGDLIGKDPLDESQAFEYKPHKYGPYSKELHDWLDDLADKKLIDYEKKSTAAGNEKNVYRWAENGETYLSESSLDTDLEERVEDTLDRFNSMPLLELLDEVYDEYPEYTTNSVL